LYGFEEFFRTKTTHCFDTAIVFKFDNACEEPSFPFHVRYGAPGKFKPISSGLDKSVTPIRRELNPIFKHEKPTAYPQLSFLERPQQIE